MPLKELLNQRGIKQKWLAENLQVSETTMSSWCNGKSKPRNKYILKLSSVLNVSQNTIHTYL